MKTVLSDCRVHTLEEAITALQDIAKAYAGDERSSSPAEIHLAHSGRFGGDGWQLYLHEESLSDGSVVLSLLVAA